MIAQERYEVIRPLLGNSGRSRTDVQNVARKHGCGVTIVYRWLKVNENDGRGTSFLPRQRSDKGFRVLHQRSRLS